MLKGLLKVAEVPVALVEPLMPSLPARVVIVVEGKTSRDNVLVPVPVALVALKFTLNVPETVGVPDMAPVLLASVNPAGRSIAA